MFAFLLTMFTFFLIMFAFLIECSLSSHFLLDDVSQVLDLHSVV